MTKRILYLISGLGTGGAERSLAELLPWVADAGWTPTVVCFHPRPEGVHEAVRAQGIDVRLLADMSWPARIAGVRKIIRSERPHLIHSALFDATMVARIAKLGTATPLLTSLVNTPYASARYADTNVTPWKLRSVQAAENWTSRGTTHFHAITRAVKDAAVRDLRISADSITVIERGRAPARLGTPSAGRRERARRTLGLAEDDLVLVNAARQEYQKGQVHLLEAMPQVLADHNRSVLLVAGRPGHATAELERAGGELMRAGKVRFLGHREDLPDVLASADVFVFPSLYEGLGGTAIEAMALGLPVVASDIPALREVLEEGHNADLVPPATPDRLAKTISVLLGDPDRMRRYATRSRAIFEERFTLDRSATRMLDLYASVLARGDCG